MAECNRFIFWIPCCKNQVAESSREASVHTKNKNHGNLKAPPPPNANPPGSQALLRFLIKGSGIMVEKRHVVIRPYFRGEGALGATLNFPWKNAPPSSARRQTSFDTPSYSSKECPSMGYHFHRRALGVKNTHIVHLSG